MIKKRLVVLAALIVSMLLVITFSGCEQKQNIIVPELKQNVYVYDQDSCIDDEVEAEINLMIKELEEKTEAEFAIISIQGLNGYTIEEYANELFNTLGIGKEGKDNGVLLLFSKADKRVRLEIGRGLEGCLNDAKCGRILDDYFVPYREEDDYTTASKNTVIAVLNVIADEYQVELENVEEMQVDEDKKNDAPIWVYIVVFALIFIVAILKSSGDNEWYGGGYHGGFSGGSRSGGGFGGGRSGGGGASR